mgnify:CR=1 FL=1
MALILKDRVKQQTTTTGTGTYTLSGSFDSFQTFAEIGDGNTTYYCCTDGTDFEVGRGTFTASGTTLSREEILSSSNSDAKVNWSAGTRTIFCTQPADKAVFLNADGDIQLKVGNDLKLSTGSGEPVIRIAGGGPNGMRFYDGTDFADLTNAVDIKYRTTPNDLLIERSENSNIIAEFGGDDGHAALYYDNAKKLETLTGGVDVTGNITVSGTVDGRDLASDGTKLDGIEDSADVTDTANVTAAGALMDSEVTNLADVKSFDPADYATAAQGTTADAALPKAGGTMTGNLELNNVNIVFEGSTADSNETTLTAIDPTADRTISLPNQSGTVMVTIGDSYRSGVSQTYSGDSYLVDGEYQEIATVTPSGGSHNYFFAGRIIAQSGLNAHTLNINVALRSNTLPDLSWSITYDEDVIGTVSQYITPVLFVKETSPASFILAVEVHNTIFGTLTADLDFFARTQADLADISVNTTDSSEITAVPTGYTAYQFTKTTALDKFNAVELYYDNSKKLETTSNGVTMTAEHVFINQTDDGSSEDPQLILQRISSTPADNDLLGSILFRGRDDNGSTVNYAKISSQIADATDGTEDGYLILQASEAGTSNVTHARFGAGEITFFKDTTFQDNVKAKFGTGDDLQIYHDGSGSYISEAGTGLLYINSTPGGWIRVGSGDETSAYFKGNGAAELYYDNVKKLETTSTGVDVTGDATISGDLFVNGGTIRSEDGTLDFGDNSADNWGQISYQSGADINGFGSQFGNAIRFSNEQGGANQHMLLLDTQAGNNSNIFGVSGNDQPVFGVTGDSHLKLYYPNGSSNSVTISPTTPTASRTITLPDATGTVALENGNAVLLNTTTVSSGVSSVDFGSSLITDDFDNYLLVVEDLTVSAATDIRLRLGTGNSADNSNLYTGNAQWRGKSLVSTTNGTQSFSGSVLNGNNAILMGGNNQDVATAVTQSANFSLRFDNLRSTTFHKTVNGLTGGCFMTDTVGANIGVDYVCSLRDFAVTYANTSAVNFISIYETDVSSQISGGTFSLYGLKT